MQKLFNNILVPVDFSSKSLKAVQKATDMAREYDCSIHLLHVVSVSPFAAIAAAEGHLAIPYGLIDNRKELGYQLNKWSRYITRHSDGKVKAGYSILSGSWDETIIDFIIQHRFDLLVIGRKAGVIKKRNMLLDADKIAEKTNIPVLTVPSNRRVTRLFSIVIPITDFLPIRKLMYGIYIASRYDTTIKLLGVQSKDTDEIVKHYLNRAYQLIRDNCEVKTEMKTVTGESMAEAINQFARREAADLVILNPRIQNRMQGLFSSFLGKIIQKYSDPPVLSVNPV